MLPYLLIFPLSKIAPTLLQMASPLLSCPPLPCSIFNRLLSPLFCLRGILLPPLPLGGEFFYHPTPNWEAPIQLRDTPVRHHITLSYSDNRPAISISKCWNEQGVVEREVGGGWAKWVMGIKEGTFDEHCVFYFYFFLPNFYFFKI